jgi:hypothetical protein
MPPYFDGTSQLSAAAAPVETKAANRASARCGWSSDAPRRPGCVILAGAESYDVPGMAQLPYSLY